MTTVPQTDTAQEPEPDRGPRGESPTGRRGAPQAGSRRQAHWHAPLVGVVGRPWKRHKKHPTAGNRTDPLEEPSPLPPLPGTEPAGVRRLLRHIEPLGQIARAARFYPARLAVAVFAAWVLVPLLAGWLAFTSRDA